MRYPSLRSWTAPVVSIVGVLVAVGLLVLDRQVGSSQQRINVRWAAEVGDADRRAAEVTLTLHDGEEVEPTKWIYRLADHSRRKVRQIVEDPRVADTAHIDRARFTVQIDAPDMPIAIRRFLEAGYAWPSSLCAGLLALVAGWRGRRELSWLLGRVIVGRDVDEGGAPRHMLPVRPDALNDAADALTRPVVATLLAVQDEWDWWASRIYVLIVAAVLALMVLYTGWHGRELAANWDPWTIADWLVTYSGGFVRRGLSGELVLATSGALNTPANTVAWALFVLVFVTFCAAFAALLRIRRVTFWFMTLCLSPAFLLFTLYNPDTVGRKDGLLLASVTLWALTVSRRPASLAQATMFAAIAFVLTLMHELYFFFTPYFVLLSYLVSRQRQMPERWWAAALVPIGSGIALLLILVFSTSLSNPALCDRLVAAGAPATVCEGVLSYGHESIREAVQDVLGAATGPAAASFGTAFALMLLPPMLCLLISVRTIRTGYAGIAAIVGALLFSAPLFVLALDWGRWLAIHAALVTIACATLLPLRDRLPYRPPLTRRTAGALAVGVVVIALMFSWNVKHCCRGTLVSTFAPFQVVHDMWQEFEF